MDIEELLERAVKLFLVFSVFMAIPTLLLSFHPILGLSALVTEAVELLLIARFISNANTFF